MKKMMLIGLVFVICGCIVGEICMGRLFALDAFLSRERFLNYAHAHLIFSDMTWNLFYQRFKIYLGMIVISFAPFREYLFRGLLGGYLFAFGFFLMQCVGAMGFVGIAIAVGSLLPQGLFYFFGFRMVIARSPFGHKFAGHSILHGRRSLGMTGLLSFLFLVAGCIIESVMSVHVLPWMIRLSLI